MPLQAFKPFFPILGESPNVDSAYNNDAYSVNEYYHVHITVC